MFLVFLLPLPLIGSAVTAGPSTLITRNGFGLNGGDSLFVFFCFMRTVSPTLMVLLVALVAMSAYCFIFSLFTMSFRRSLMSTGLSACFGGSSGNLVGIGRLNSASNGVTPVVACGVAPVAAKEVINLLVHAFTFNCGCLGDFIQVFHEAFCFSIRSRPEWGYCLVFEPHVLCKLCETVR